MEIQGFGNGDMKSISAFESNCGVKLPDVNIDVLFGINIKDTELSLELWLNDYRSDMPESTIIIGASYQHGLIIMICSGADAGIYYWDHAYEFACSNDETNTYYIAKTFTEFIQSLF